MFQTVLNVKVEFSLLDQQFRMAEENSLFGLFLLETRSHCISPASLELTLQIRVILNLQWLSCLCLPAAGITNVYHHTLQRLQNKQTTATKQISANSCLSYVSFAGTKHHGQNQHREKRVYFNLQLIAPHPGQGAPAGQEPGGRSSWRGHERVLPSGLLLMDWLIDQPASL